MKNPENHTPETDSNEESAVWDLLSQSEPAKAGPFFSRNVMREVRLVEAEATADRGFFAWFRQPVAALCGAAAAIVILAVALAPGNTVHPGNDEVVVSAEAAVEDPADEFASVDYIGQLMAVNDPASLDDQAFAELF